MVWNDKNIKEAFEIIIDTVSKGSSLSDAIKEYDKTPKPCRDTFYKWINENKEFADKYARARDLRADKLFEEILEIADKQGEDIIIDKDGNEFTNHNVINRNKLQIDSRKWILSKMNPKKYGDKMEVEQSGNMTIIWDEKLTDAPDSKTE